MGIRYTGFADEASSGIHGQIEATLELGWKSIEARAIDGTNIVDLSDEAFDAAASALHEAGIRVDCFGSAVANWGKDPRKEEDFERSMAELRRAIPRMRRLGTTMIRGMSFLAIKDEVPDSPEITSLVVGKVKKLVRTCEEAGILYLHENCMNYGGMSWEHSLRLAEAIGSPAFAFAFDTGNPVFTDDRRGQPPYSKQSSWAFYEHIRHLVRYVHIKDGVYVGPSDGIFPKVRFVWPGEGDGEVRRIVADLVARGYDGFLSIEPHMETVYHEGSTDSPEAARKATYVEYGRRLMRLVSGL